MGELTQELKRQSWKTDNQKHGPKFYRGHKENGLHLKNVWKKHLPKNHGGCTVEYDWNRLGIFGSWFPVGHPFTMEHVMMVPVLAAFGWSLCFFGHRQHRHTVPTEVCHDSHGQSGTFWLWTDTQPCVVHHWFSQLGSDQWLFRSKGYLSQVRFIWSSKPICMGWSGWFCNRSTALLPLIYGQSWLMYSSSKCWEDTCSY